MTRIASFLVGSVGGFIAGAKIPSPRLSLTIGLASGLGGNFIKHENGRSLVVGIGSGMAVAGVLRAAGEAVVQGSGTPVSANSMLVAHLTGKTIAPAATPTKATLPESQSTLTKDDLVLAGLGNIRYLNFQHAAASAPKQAPEAEFAGLDMFMRDMDKHSQEMVDEAMRRQTLKENTVVPAYEDDDEDELDQQY
jgi:hypothetical protein